MTSDLIMLIKSQRLQKNVQIVLFSSTKIKATDTDKNLSSFLLIIESLAVVIVIFNCS